MKTIKIGDKEFVLEFTFEAAEYKSLVQRMFNMMTGAYIVKDAEDLENPTASNMIDGTVKMFADIPETCNIAFYAGFLENNPMSEEDSKKVMRSYMKENNISYSELFEQIKECMEKDGFFHLTGLDEMISQMFTDQTKEKKEPKTPTDHKKAQTKSTKSTSTK